MMIRPRCWREDVFWSSPRFTFFFIHDCVQLFLLSKGRIRILCAGTWLCLPPCCEYAEQILLEIGSGTSAALPSASLSTQNSSVKTERCNRRLRIYGFLGKNRDEDTWDHAGLFWRMLVHDVFNVLEITWPLYLQTRVDSRQTWRWWVRYSSASWWVCCLFVCFTAQNLQLEERSARPLIHHFDVKKRACFGNTSMDAEISFLMANQTLVRS